jgi:hypothetical protein
MSFEQISYLAQIVASVGVCSAAEAFAASISSRV